MIPFVDLRSQFERIEEQVRARVDRVLAHGQFILGPEVAELEQELARFTGAAHAVSCSSGTDALLMALMAYNVGPGDAVFTTPFTFVATAEVIALLGATPVFVDVDPGSFNMDPDHLEAALRALEARDPSKYPLPGNYEQIAPRVVIPVDLFGLPCDYDRIQAVAGEHGLVVIEDAAQSFGAEYKGQKACCFGHAGCASFFPAKPLGCYGDGGAVFTNDDALAEILLSIRVHGKGADKYDNVRIGLNGRLDTLQAAVLLAKLTVFQDEVRLREGAARRYTELLAPLAPAVVTPETPAGYRSAWAQYSLVSDRKPRIMAALKEHGIPTAVYYPRPLHLQTAFSYLGYRPGAMPHSERCSETIFSVPMHPYLEDDQIVRTADVIRSACRSTG